MDLQTDVLAGKLVEGYTSPDLPLIWDGFLRTAAVDESITPADKTQYNENLAALVRGFQQANHLPVTGSIDADTWNLLIKSGIVRIPTPGVAVPSLAKVLGLLAVAVGGVWLWRRYGRRVKKALAGPGQPLDPKADAREERERAARRAARIAWVKSVPRTVRSATQQLSGASRPRPKAQAPTRKRLGDIVTDQLLDRPGELAAAGRCRDAIVSLDKVALVAHTARDRKLLNASQGRVKRFCPDEFAKQAETIAARHEEVEAEFATRGTRGRYKPVSSEGEGRPTFRVELTPLERARLRAEAKNQDPAAKLIRTGAEPAGGRPKSAPWYIKRDPKTGRRTKITTREKTRRTAQGPKTILVREKKPLDGH